MVAIQGLGYVVVDAVRLAVVLSWLTDGRLRSRLAGPDPVGGGHRDRRTLQYDSASSRPTEPSLVENSVLAEYVEQFKRFKVFKAGGVEKVHKPCMLLAVSDLAERGALAENKVRYEDTLDGFREYAEALRPN